MGILAEKSTGFYKEKGSKFWAYAFPVQNLEEVEEALNEVKSKHPSSRHYCYAYQIGKGDSSYIRANDHGEPNGSAGLPILNQIKSAALKNVLIVVARDFGGTKLGIAGLIRAYKTAAQASLDQAHTVEEKDQAKIFLQFGFEDHGEVMSILDKNNLSVQNSVYESLILFELIVDKKDIHTFKKLIGALNVKIKIEDL